MREMRRNTKFWPGNFKGSSQCILVNPPYSVNKAAGGSVHQSVSLLVGKSEGKRSLGRPRRRWDDNKGMTVRDTGWERADWIHLAQDMDQ